MSSEGTPPATDTPDGRGRSRGRGRGRGRGARGHGRRWSTNGVGSEREGTSQPMSQSTAGQDVPADELASTPVPASSAPAAQTSALSSTVNGPRGKPRRKSNASRGSSSNHPSSTVSDPPKPATTKEVPPHLAGPGLDADILVNKVKALATHSKNSSVDSRYVPAMGLDWADEEEDPESLPDLSQWAVSKPSIVVDQMQCVKEEEPTLPDLPNDEAVPSGSQKRVTDATPAIDTTTMEQSKVTEEIQYDKRQSQKPRPKRKDKEPREPGGSGGSSQPPTPVQESNVKRKTLYERIYGETPPPAPGQEPSAPESPTRDDRPSRVSSESDSRPPYPNHGFRGRGRGRGRGRALHLAHLPFHPANLQRRQHAAAAGAASSTQQTATSSDPHHEQPAPLPSRSQERPHTRPVIDKGALARFGLSLADPKPPAGSPRQPPPVPS
jgi:hypothetical protein